jgi:hypothetical protein
LLGSGRGPGGKDEQDDGAQPDHQPLRNAAVPATSVLRDDHQSYSVVLL